MFWWLKRVRFLKKLEGQRGLQEGGGGRTVSFQMFCFDTKWPKITIIFVFNAMQLHVLKQKSVAKGVLCF